MALSLEQEWTLVACGLIAYADGILEDDEWNQILYMIDGSVPAEDAQRWLGLLSEREALIEHMKSLSPPPDPDAGEHILEKSWRMAMADGRASYAEAVMHDYVAEELGVPVAQTEAWRLGWTARAGERAEMIAGFAALIAHADGHIASEEHQSYNELLERLPFTDDDDRKKHLERFSEPPDREALLQALTDLDEEDRHLALRALVPLVKAGGGEVERALFFELSTLAELDAKAALQLLEQPERIA